MEGRISQSLEAVQPIDFDDGKYVSGLSAILVASIQEAKDKICQIEYLFCSQIYPSFQSKQKSLQKIYSEAKKAAEDSWKEKENEFRSQVEKLRFEKKQAVDQYEEKMQETLEELRCKEVRVQQLERTLMMKIKEADEGIVLQKDLIQTIQRNNEAVVSKEKQLKEHEKKTNLLLADLRSMEENVEVLQKELREKTKEVEEGRKLQHDLKKQADQLVEHEKEKEQLLSKVNCLEEKANELQLKTGKRNGKVAEEEGLCKDLIQQIELKDSELKAEHDKFRKVIDAYKRLKSQYNFLLNKSALTSENTTRPQKLQGESEPLKHHHNRKPSPDNACKTPEAPAVACDIIRVKEEIVFNDKLEDAKGFKSIKTFPPLSPPSNLRIAEGSAGVKSCPIVGTKRRSSGWRETRSRHRPSGFDPHDDFLDTPLDNIRENLNKTLNEGAADDFPVPAGVQSDSLDDETQDMNVDPRPENEQIPIEVGDKREFKYVAPIRKKSERENLKGFECNQCKKFYDAVLDDGSNKQQNTRCEHHQGVSRHRYKYNPPLTPEGFWNIGFESEM